MAIIADKRRLRIHQVVSRDGELLLEPGAECWQNESGSVCGTGLWYSLINPCPEDLEAQAKAKNVSALEWLRLKLSTVIYLQVEIL